MYLREAIWKGRETRQDYRDRTYWNGCMYPKPDIVLEFRTPKDRDDPKAKPIRIITMDEARVYLNTLNPEPRENRVVLRAEKGQDICVHVQTNLIAGKETCAWCGKVIKD